MIMPGTTETATNAPISCPAGHNEDINRYIKKAARTRTPLLASFALTHRCTFRCRHCYLGNQEAIRNHKNRELDTKTILRLLDEMADAGTLFLTLTGGDPMIRSDFAIIYEHAVKLGLLVTVYCNGSLITENIIQLFQKYPPRMVEVSIYGATEQTYCGVTLTSNGFSLFKTGINRLQDAGIRYKLKTMVMTLNSHELSAMNEMAAGLRVHFYHDTTIIPCLDNDDNDGIANGATEERPLSSPLELRLSPEDAAQIDGSTDELISALTDMANKEHASSHSNKLNQCGAALFGYHIDPYGWMQPCLISKQIRYDLNKAGSIFDGWNNKLIEFRKQKVTAAYPCSSCKHKCICTGCPETFTLESGNQEQPPFFYCRRAKKSHHIAFADRNT